MRVSRTVKKNGKVVYAGWRWQSNDLIPLRGRWVWIVVGASDASTVRIEDKDGARLADAARAEQVTWPQRKRK